jgi:hypothetical protein
MIMLPFERQILEYAGEHDMREAVEVIAERLLEKTRVSYGRVSLQTIAASLRVTSIEEADIPCEGLLLPHKDGTYSIHVASTSRQTRRRFSIAHEFSHIALHEIEPLTRSIERRTLFLTPGNRTEETFCDRLAAAILMPRRTFVTHFRRTGLSISAIQNLAKRYQVSLTAASRRIKELGLCSNFALAQLEPTEAGRCVRWIYSNFQHSPLRKGASAHLLRNQTGRLRWVFVQHKNVKEALLAEFERGGLLSNAIGLFIRSTCRDVLRLASPNT